jgi:disulfide bond formation protein DsbB
MDRAKAGQVAGWLAILTPLALLGGAYVSQYGFGLVPCEMCWWQRNAHFAALAFAALAFLLSGQAKAFVALAALAIAVSGGIGLFHAGVEYHWWEGLTRCATQVAAGSTNPLDAIMNTPYVRCDAAQWSLFGISLAGWNFLFSTAAAITIAMLLSRSAKGAP